MVAPRGPSWWFLFLLTCALPGHAQELSASQRERLTPVAEVVREVGPAVVNVYQEVFQDVDWPKPYNRIWGPIRTKRSSLGSGVIVDPEGYVLTNAHVVDSEHPGSIHVRLSDGGSYVAQLVSTDPANDVALLKIAPSSPLRAARLGTSADALVGETVIAIGNPLGNENTVTTGIVSSVYRDVRLPGLQGRFKDFLQVDAAINPGNSGGPLLNIRGEVIGLNWAVITGAEGIGFAIPIDRVRTSLADVLLSPTVDAGLEVEADPLARRVALATVAAGGPAEDAGLRPGDLLVEVAGTPVAWEFDLAKVLARAQAGEQLDLVVRRGERLLPTKLTLREGAEAPLQYVLRALGLRVVDHPTYYGVMVEQVDPAGSAAQVPLAVRDLIDGVDGLDVDDLESLYQALRSVPSGGRVRLHLFRNGLPLLATVRVR